MAVREAKGNKVNYLIIFLSGLVLLITAFLVFTHRKNIYGNYELKEIIPTKNNLKFYPMRKRKGRNTLFKVYRNCASFRKYLVRDNVDTWKKFIKNSKLDYDIISDQTIELGESFDYKMIVL